MFKLFHRTPKGNLTNTSIYNEQSFYDAFVKDVKRAQSSVVIESPYLTERRTMQFLRIFWKLRKKGVAVRVNTRNPRHHDKLLEIQAWKSIRLLRDNGIKVYFYSDMRHRKLAIIDNTILWEGSLNILSQVFSKEIMRRTVSEQLARQMASFTKINSRFWWYTKPNMADQEPYQITEEDIQKVITYLKFHEPQNASREYAIEFIESMQIKGNEIARSDEALAQAIEEFTKKKHQD